MCHKSFLSALSILNQVENYSLVRLSSLLRITQLVSTGAETYTQGAWIPELVPLRLPHQWGREHSKYSADHAWLSRHSIPFGADHFLKEKVVWGGESFGEERY